jgi:hypothetical protein
MTDNEKAATFIGWSPDHREEWRLAHGLFESAAPDMNKPENYTQALEALVKKYGAIQLTLTHHGVGIATPGFAHEVVENDWCDALATLYDSEQSKQP